MESLAKLIDHTLLKPEANQDQIKKICEEAKAYQFASVCVNPTWVQYAAQMLKNTDIKVCTVVGFPLGANTSETKAFEAKKAIEQGAHEIDMVINIGALKSKNFSLVNQDIAAVCAAAKGKAIVKVIIETSLLTNEEIEKVCTIAKDAGADFVKTSTGFSGGGATEEAVTLMRKTVGPDIGVKASGGVRTYKDVQNMVKAGATRIGTSGGVEILKGTSSTSNY